MYIIMIYKDIRMVYKDRWTVYKDIQRVYKDRWTVYKDIRMVTKTGEQYTRINV